jgi:S-adenosylmethionine:tRNA ribosyltransferase-isomerase
VVPARLRGCRQGQPGQVEVLLVRAQDDGSWLAMGRPARRLSAGTVLSLAQGRLTAVVLAGAPEGRLLLRFDPPDVLPLLEEVGEVPLPPYIHRPPEPEDRARYQTVYASEPGAIAAPTAGLHFTAELLRDIQARGTAVVPVTLHVGPGTFAPIRSADPARHRLEPEYYRVEEHSAETLRQRRRAGGRIVAVGTTAVRALETCAAATGQVQAGEGWSATFIHPPYQFAAVDALVTNFHLPGSTLLLLVAAFAGRERLLEAYRFYSYGDAMFVF